MSRVGNKTITILEGVSVSIDDNNFVVVKGPKGELSFSFNPKMKITVDGNILKVERPSDSIEDKTLHGTTRALLHNMVQGVTAEYSKTLLMEPLFIAAFLYLTVVIGLTQVQKVLERRLAKSDRN